MLLKEFYLKHFFSVSTRKFKIANEVNIAFLLALV